MSIILIWMHVGVMNFRVEAARSGLVQFFRLLCPHSFPHLSICLFVHASTHSCICPLIQLTLHPSICLSNFPSIHAFIHAFNHSLLRLCHQSIIYGAPSLFAECLPGVLRT